MKFLSVFVITLLFALVACEKPETVVSSNTSSAVSEINEKLNSDSSYVILDVRTPAEYTAGHIKGAINIDINDESFKTKIQSLDNSKTYVVHCTANVENGRSDKSIAIMKAQGFEKLVSMSGGIASWQASGLPTVK